jgi:hypothetical protein
MLEYVGVVLLSLKQNLVQILCSLTTRFENVGVRWSSFVELEAKFNANFLLFDDLV